MLGFVLLVLAPIPVGDITTVLFARGSRTTAFGVHGLTALFMLAGAIPLIVQSA